MKIICPTLQKMSINYPWIIRYSFFFISLLPVQTFAGPAYQYNQAIQEVYQNLLNLEFAAAKQQLQQIEKTQPNNLARHHLWNYYDFFRVYTSDTEANYKALKNNRDKYLAQLEKGPEDSPWHLYSQADIRLQWALLKFRFGDYWAGFLEVKKAYSLLQKNQERFPAFAPNYKDLGILHAMVGTVPDQYQWGLRMLTGLKGTVKQGKKEMHLALANQQAETFFLHTESKMLYCFLLLYLDKEPSEAWQVLQKEPASQDRSLLEAFTYANVAARSGNNEAVIKVLNQQQQRTGWSAFPFLEFTLGNAQLRKLDPQAAVHFQRFLNTYQGQNDIKATYLRLAWCALLKKDKNKYLSHLQSVQKAGNNASGRDKDALHLANLDFIPNVQLIRARLLFDGGYYKQAETALNVYHLAPANNAYEQLEAIYRQARITHRMLSPKNAIQDYQKVLEIGADQPYYFACNSALQLGIIYEDIGQQQTAERYYKKCLELKPEIYKNSLHLSAKAGLQRLE
jgi:hypothetical protein